jgi:type II secretory pathway predicted ATPase ExeA
MYESFYNLHPTPFRLTPDPHFFFESDTHKRGLAYLRFAFYQEEGFVVVTGAPGTGKTELMLNLVSELPRHKVTLAKIVTSNLDADDLLDLVAASFLINPEHLSKGSLLKRLEDFFIHQAHNGKHVLLLIDEAHNLSIKSLMELSMLSNFQINEKPVMQCFLLGQEPLEEKLNIPELVHLKQRVLASTRLESLSQQETRDYITHRLQKSGWENNPIIRDAAFALIHYYTKGIPRKINSFCNRVLLQSFLDERNDVGADLVHQVIEELQGEILAKDPAIDLDILEAQLPAEELLLHTSDSLHAESANNHDTYPDNTSNKNMALELSTAESRNENTSSSPRGKNSAKQPTPKNNTNVIAIPEFIKKKENAQTRIEAPATAPATQADIADSKLESTDSKTTAIAAQESAQITARNIGSEKPDSKRPLQQLNGTGLKSALSQAEPHKSHEHESQKKRQSGLVDKELQALASLCDTTAQKPAKKEDALPGAQAQATIPAKKIIIDDLACEEAEFNKEDIIPDYDEPDFVTRISLVLERYRNWRPAASAMVILISIGLSIYWLSDGNTENIETAGKSQAQEILADSSVIDLLIPEVQTTLIEKTPETTVGIETATAGITDDTGPFFTNESAINQNIANVLASTVVGEKNTSTAELDSEITSIVEKPGAEVKAVSAAPITVPQKENQPAKLADVMASNIATNSQSPTRLETPTKKSPVTQERRSEIQTTTELESVPQATNTVRPPIVGTPLALNQNAPTNAGPATATIAEEPGAESIPDVTDAEKSISTIKDKDTSHISGNDLRMLLSTLANAYENGNLQKLISTFATDIYSSDGAGRQQMENDYRRLFNITDNRELTINDITWSQQDKQMLGRGDFQVRIREKGANKYTTYAGKISLAVVKESNNIVIRKLDYDYNN